MNKGLVVIILVSQLYCVWSSGTIQKPVNCVWKKDWTAEQRSKRLCEDDCTFFHNETRKCYIPTFSSNARYNEVTNPCGKLQNFYEKDDTYGICACQWADGDLAKRRCYDMVSRPVLSWPGSNRCYYAYSKGPCRSGEWIVMNPKTTLSECKPNPCHNLPKKEIVLGLDPQPDQSEVFYFVKNNRGYQTFTRAFCRANQYARFFGTHATPECTDGDWSCMTARSVNVYTKT